MPVHHDQWFIWILFHQIFIRLSNNASSILFHLLNRLIGTGLNTICQYELHNRASYSSGTGLNCSIVTSGYVFLSKIKLHLLAFSLSCPLTLTLLTVQLFVYLYYPWLYLLLNIILTLQTNETSPVPHGCCKQYEVW